MIKYANIHDNDLRKMQVDIAGAQAGTTLLEGILHPPWPEKRGATPESCANRLYMK